MSLIYRDIQILSQIAIRLILITSSNLLRNSNYLRFFDLKMCAHNPRARHASDLP